MATVSDLKILFPLGECDLQNMEEIKARIITFINDDSLVSGLTSLNEQTAHAEDGPRPRGGSVSCSANSSGGIICTGTWNF